MPREVRITEAQIFKAINAGKGITFEDERSAKEYRGKLIADGYTVFMGHPKGSNKWTVLKVAKRVDDGGVSLLDED
jgi:hypothetical protein